MISFLPQNYFYNFWKLSTFCFKSKRPILSIRHYLNKRLFEFNCSSIYILNFSIFTQKINVKMSNKISSFTFSRISIWLKSIRLRIASTCDSVTELLYIRAINFVWKLVKQRNSWIPFLRRNLFYYTVGSNIILYSNSDHVIWGLRYVFFFLNSCDYIVTIWI